MFINRPKLVQADGPSFAYQHARMPTYPVLERHALTAQRYLLLCLLLIQSTRVRIRRVRPTSQTFPPQK